MTGDFIGMAPFLFSFLLCMTVNRIGHFHMAVRALLYFTSQKLINVCGSVLLFRCFGYTCSLIKCQLCEHVCSSKGSQLFSQKLNFGVVNDYVRFTANTISKYCQFST